MAGITYAEKANLRHITRAALDDLTGLLNDLSEGKRNLNPWAYSRDQLLSVLDALEILDDTLRCRAYELKQDDPASRKRYMESFITAPAEVSCENGTLRIFTRMTLGRKQCRKYRIAAAVHDALELYQESNHRKLAFLFEPPVAVFVVRHARTIERTMFDNDNNEDSAIINEVFSFLGMSDDVTCMRLYSNGVKEVRDGEKEGVEIIVTPLKEASGILNAELLPHA